MMMWMMRIWHYELISLRATPNELQKNTIREIVVVNRDFFVVNHGKKKITIRDSCRVSNHA